MSLSELLTLRPGCNRAATRRWKITHLLRAAPCQRYQHPGCARVPHPRGQGSWRSRLIDRWSQESNARAHDPTLCMSRPLRTQNHSGAEQRRRVSKHAGYHGDTRGCLRSLRTPEANLPVVTLGINLGFRHRCAKAFSFLGACSWTRGVRCSAAESRAERRALGSARALPPRPHNHERRNNAGSCSAGCPGAIPRR